mmetsp:Transcript_36445/g.113567  ORF Transcript_36445/g.113567 Transcript_36445/m.113567 type:complete len:130 (-) Transcript_36445:136-525(-)
MGEQSAQGLWRCAVIDSLAFENIKMPTIVFRGKYSIEGQAGITKRTGGRLHPAKVKPVFDMVILMPSGPWVISTCRLHESLCAWHARFPDALTGVDFLNSPPIKPQHHFGITKHPDAADCPWLCKQPVL